MITYNLAQKGDLTSISNLLQKSSLPYSDLKEGSIEFIILKENETLIGCIGLELFGKHGLLRSFAVEEEYRMNGFGKELYKRMLSYAVQRGITTLHILTNTAEQYFKKKGFLIENRANAPEEILQTTEFSSLCPSTSTYMVLKNISKVTHFFSSKFNKLHFESQSNSSYWAMKGEKVSLTLFSIPANTDFEEHSHDSEQITYVLDGKLSVSIQNEIYHLEKGDTVIIPSNVTHKFWSVAGATAVDSWSSNLPYND